LAPTYIVCMSTCFVAAMYMTVIDTVVKVHLNMLPSPLQKEMLAQQLSPTIARVHLASVALLAFFLMGLLMTGYVKVWKSGVENAAEEIQVAYSLRYGWLELLGGLLGLCGVVAAVLGTRHTARTALRAKCHETLRDSFRCRRFIRTLDVRANSTIFQAGNIFYEILLSGINDQDGYRWINLAYFGCSVLSFVFGTIGICFCNQFNYWVQQMKSSRRKTYYAFLFRSSESHLLFAYIGSIYCWLMATLFASGVKDPDVWYFSTAWASFGLLVITASIYHLHMLGAHFVAQDAWEPEQPALEMEYAMVNASEKNN